MTSLAFAAVQEDWFFGPLYAFFKSWGHWPLHRDLPDDLPQGAILVDERLASGGVRIGESFVAIQ